MKILLTRADRIQRDEDGRPWAWQSGETIAEFASPEELLIYVEHHLSELKDAVVFTGSASLLNSANAFLGNRLMEAGLL